MSHLLILVPFCCVIILNLPIRKVMRSLAPVAAIVLSLLQVLMVLCFDCHFWQTKFGIIGTFFKFNLVADKLAILMLLCIGIVSFVTAVIGRALIKERKERFDFASLILISLSALNGIVLVRDIFSLYVFLEIAAVISFILIAFKTNILAYEGAFKYIIFSAVASIFLLCGTALLLITSGSTDFSQINASLTAQAFSPSIVLAVGLFLVGLFIKAGVVPFHWWLPDAYSEAPSPVSVYLAGIVTKAVGVYALIRVAVSVFGMHKSICAVFLLLGAITIVAGAIAAITQSDFKRMLSYSSISQVGYIILALGSGTSLGVAAACFHLFNHAIFKSLLFVNAAAVEQQTGTRDMDRVCGLSQRMPVTGLTSVLGSLSCAGIPPLAGFWSKLLIVIALLSTGHFVYAAVAVLASIITLGYFLVMQRKVFFGKISEEFINIKEAGLGIVVPEIILAAITVGVGIFFPVILNRFILPLGG
ncbi:MAG: NADH-quinone oxidoreductase subunit L [Candidatus Omnitrophica bacterium]|nr:NADH-quinone oxidoreductase subunit L [Candidatus Omnitrophota bacterium]